MFKPLTVLVTGATGNQGGALARLLLKRGHLVRAFTRHPDSPQARELELRGAELFPGDFEDEDSLRRAAQGVDAFFAMATPYAADGLHTEREVRHGRHQLEAAQLAHVPHFLYSSVAGASLPTGIPHFDSKHHVEQLLLRSGLPFTIVAPVFFMENFLGPSFTEGLAQGVLSMALPRHRGLQMIPMADLAAFCARVLEWPEQFLGQRIEVASDEVTGEQAAALISYVSGRKVHYHELPLEALYGRREDMGRMYEWFDRVGYHADIAALRRDFPDVGWHTFENWARAQDWEALLGSSWRGTFPTEPASSP